MEFDSFSAFIAMGGHGPYVWACYGVFFVLLSAVMIWSVQSQKAVIEACRRVYETQGAESSGKVSHASATFKRVNVSND
ncbi:MAG TPA: heme exporter protein CcmD [Marinobacter sp.]|nr:heme exporter protein CcmD [Marinobacter sp.]